MKERSVGIVGLGLIGSSIARALREVRAGRPPGGIARTEKAGNPRLEPCAGELPAESVAGNTCLARRGDFNGNAQCGIGSILGYDVDEGVCRRAVEVGLVDKLAPSVGQLASESDLVVIAVPVGAIVQVALEAAEALKPGGVVTDTGSAKAAVVEALEAVDSLRGKYVGGHPMAGSEKNGIDAGRADLFAGAPYVITPTRTTSQTALDAVRWFAEMLGCHPIVELDPRSHDEAVAAVSHVPYLSACALSLAVDDAPEAWRLASSGFRDSTRVASADPLMSADFCLANRDAILRRLGYFVQNLQALQEAIGKGDRTSLIALLKRAKLRRETIVSPGASFR